jgi:hypothetical protein
MSAELPELEIPKRISEGKKWRLSIPLNSENDMTLTQVYARKAWNGEEFVCFAPECDFKTKDGNEFVKHFQTHIEEFLTASWTYRE